MNHDARSATAISSRHVVMAAHYPAFGEVHFTGTNGVPVAAKVIRSRQIGKTDILIGLLDRDLPREVVPARIMPVGFLKQVSKKDPLWTATFNRRNQAFLGRLLGVETGSGFLRNGDFTNLKSCPLTGVIIGGDSGCPVFVLEPEGPLLVFLLQHGNRGDGPGLHFHRTEIQSAMNELMPGCLLRE